MKLEEARTLFNELVKSDKVKMHCREVEVIMAGLAEELNEDKEQWAIAGLLHDMDIDLEPDLKNHGKKAAEILEERTDCPEEIRHAILAHNEENTGVKRESKIDFALAAAENVSGLVYAYALMRHSLDGMEAKGLKKKMKDKGFAATVRRDLIQDIEKTGLELNRFFEIAIKSVQGIAPELGF